MNRVLAILLSSVLLGACAQTPESKETGAEESTALNRARVHTELATAYYGAGQYNIALEEVGIALSGFCSRSSSSSSWKSRTVRWVFSNSLLSSLNISWNEI